MRSTLVPFMFALVWVVPMLHAALRTEAQVVEVPFETQPDAYLEAAILLASPDYTREIVELDGIEARYICGRVDLNGDDRAEVFFYLLGPIFCGTGGCNLLLSTDDENGYSLVNTFAISLLPGFVSAERSAGWNNLLWLESGGGVGPSYVKHTLDGEKYVEQERLPADIAPKHALFSLPPSFYFL